MNCWGFEQGMDGEIWTVCFLRVIWKRGFLKQSEFERGQYYIFPYWSGAIGSCFADTEDGADEEGLCIL